MMRMQRDSRKRGTMLGCFAVGYERLCRMVLMAIVINVAMVVYMLAGAVLAGFFPAVAASYATWRTWLLDEDRSWTVRRTWSVFRSSWRAELAGANALGWIQSAVWAVLLYDRWVISHNNIGRMGAVVAGLMVVVSVLFAMFTLISWVVFVHFDEPVSWTIRMAAQMIVVRPLCSIAVALLCVLVIGVWSTWPGLLVACGLAIPSGVTVGCVYAFGRLPGLQPVRGARRNPAGNGPSAQVVA